MLSVSSLICLLWVPHLHERAAFNFNKESKQFPVLALEDLWSLNM